MRFLAQSATLVATLAMAGLALAKETVSVSGNEQIDDEIVAQAFGSPARGSFTADEIDAGVKSLFTSGFFADIKAERGPDGLRISVVENPVVGNVVFNGNVRLRDEVLQAAVRATSGSPLHEAALDADVAAIVEAYAKAGYVGARVETLVVRRDGNFADVQFTVVEGKKARIGSIEFRGASVFSQNRLKGIVSTKETSLLSKVKDDDVYDVDRSEADARAVERLYHDIGYVDVIVSSPEVVFDERENVIHLVFQVNEGRQYRVGDVSGSASTGRPSPDVKTSRLGIRTGGVYSPYHIRRAADDSAEAHPAPLFPENFNLIFADAGTVWHADSGRVAKSGATVLSDDPKIRADVALPVMKKDGDRTQFFSLSGGTRF